MLYTCSCCNPHRQYQSQKSLSNHRRKHDPNYDRSLEKIKNDRLSNYYKSPLICMTCKTTISYEKVVEGYSKKFCSRSCAARLNNHIRSGGTAETVPEKTIYKVRVRSDKLTTCMTCGEKTKSDKSNFCSIKCHQDHTWEQKKNNPETIWSSKSLRRLMFEMHNSQCQKCKRTEWNGEPIPLEVEHIDGNSDNNNLKNLTLLCCNCHAQTPTYKGRNMGNGRAFRRTRYAEGKSY